jgi:alkylation response protein AidB-like acyl-CoA dehydrogenase
MEFSYTPEQDDLRKTITNFAKKELNKNIVERDRNQVFPHDLWLKCGEMGFQGLPVDEKYGGLGLNPLSTAMALEALSYGCEDGGLVFSICAHLLACVIPIWKYGTEEQKQKYLPGLCSGKLIAVNGMTEPASGSDAFSMSTRARREADGFIITGRKTFSSNGPIADIAVLYAVTDAEKAYYGGITAFVIEKNTPGFHDGQEFEKMGLRTSKIGELVLDEVYVSNDGVLGGLGAGPTIFSVSMDWERICIGASHVGTQQRILEKSMEYARTREASGKKIGSYQAISHKIADMKVRLEASRLLAYKSAWELDKVRSATMDASITKIFVSEALVKSTIDALQIFGGYGFMTEYEVERAVRDALGSTLYSGTSEIQRNIIARWLGL